MSADVNRQPIKNLLINPSFRTVISDHDHLWVTDRFCMVRGDLFAKAPTPSADFPALPRRVVRSALAPYRNGGSLPVERTSIRYVPSWRTSEATICATGGAFIAVHSRVFEGLLATGATPRYSPENRGVGWWVEVRGRRVLVGLLLTVRLDQCVSLGDFTEVTV